MQVLPKNYVNSLTRENLIDKKPKKQSGPINPKEPDDTILTAPSNYSPGLTSKKPLNG